MAQVVDCLTTMPVILGLIPSIAKFCLKGMEILTHVTTGMQLEEISWVQKHKFCIISLI
jgi:hypothetical protein